MTLHGIRAFNSRFLEAEPLSLTGHGQDAAPGHAPVHYSPQEHGSVREFERSDAFKVFLRQFKDQLALIIDFAVPHLTTQHEKDRINHNLTTFWDHVSNLEDNFFSGFRETVYGAGKQSLDLFCSLLCNEQIDADTKITEIMQLAEGTTMCAAGCVTHLAIAARELQLKAGGILGEAWRVKERVVMATVSEIVASKHHTADGGGGDVHFRNAYINYLSATIGIPEQKDEFIQAYRLTAEQLEACRKAVEAKLTPGRVATVMAEECLARVRQHVAEKFDQGTVPVDRLEELAPLWQQLKKMYGDFHLNHVLEEDDSGDTYAPRSDAHLLAIDMLTMLQKQGLLGAHSVPQLVIGWKEKAGTRFEDVSLMQWQGDAVFWVQRRLGSMPLQRGDFERFDTASVKDADTRALLERQVIALTPADQLNDVSTDWLNDVECAKAFFSKFETVTSLSRFIAAQRAWLDRLPRDKRGALVEFILNEQKHVLVPLLAHWKELDSFHRNEYPPLGRAVVSGNALMVTALLTCGAKIEMIDDLGRTELILAAELNDVPIMQALLAHHADKEFRTFDNGETPLLSAAALANLDAARCLLEHGAKVDAVDNAGRGPLFLAIEGGGGPHFVRLLLNHRADPEQGEGSANGTALIASAQAENVEGGGALIEAGANLNARDATGRTAMIHAAALGHTGVLLLLCTAGADASIRDAEHGRTALEWAAHKGHVPALKTMLSFLGEGDVGGAKGRALGVAAAEGQFDALKLLIQEGADQTITNAKRRTPLTSAVLSGRLELVKAFIEAGADLNSKDGNQATALVVASQMEQTEIMRALIEAGVDVNAADGNGQAPLHWAAQRGKSLSVQFLLEKGAQVDLPGLYGKTACDMARTAPHDGIVAMLERAQAERRNDRVQPTVDNKKPRLDATQS